MSAMFRDDQILPTGGRYASAWRAEADKAGSGVLLEHSIHDVDLLDRLLGPVTSVSGHQRSFHGIDGIEDLVVATFELEGGGVATLTTVWHDLPDRNSLRYLEIHCERAFISAEEDWFGPVRLTVDGSTQEWAGDALLAECVRRGIPTVLPEGEFVRAVADGALASPDAVGGAARRTSWWTPSTARPPRAGSPSRSEPRLLLRSRDEGVGGAVRRAGSPRSDRRGR